VSSKRTWINIKVKVQNNELRVGEKIDGEVLRRMMKFLSSVFIVKNGFQDIFM